MMLGRNVRGMEHLSLEIACLNLKIGKTKQYLHSIKHNFFTHNSSYIIFDEINTNYFRPSLAVPSNNGETEFIRDNIEGNSWIGISDEKAEGTYRTVNNIGLNYEKWDSGQPDNGGSGILNTITFGLAGNKSMS